MIRRQFLKSVLAGFALLGLPRARSASSSSSIPLFNCSVAGFQHYDGPRCIRNLCSGNRLDLVRESDNPHDEKAIAVHSPEGTKLGYIPRYLNEIPAAHLDRGKKLHALISHVEPGAPFWAMLEITVVMA